MMRRRRTPAAAAAALLLLAGCGDMFNVNMENQSRYEAYEVAPLFPDGTVNQHPVPGTVARGELVYRAMLTEKPPLTAELLARGRERFNIFCTPCHGYAGYGDGIVVERGFPPPPSYHIPRLRNAPDAYFVKVITEGFGVMYSYAERVPPPDRWAIAAYIRALQLSQAVDVAELGEDDRRRLEALAP